MTDEQLQATADFYNITIEEAKARLKKVQEQDDNPLDPICVGCAKRPHELDSVRYAAMESEDHVVTDEECRQYVLEEEGTLNEGNGHFLCDLCYIRNGMPSSSRGWVAP